MLKAVQDNMTSVTVTFTDRGCLRAVIPVCCNYDCEHSVVVLYRPEEESTKADPEKEKEEEEE
jgi:hypothetical protein